VLDRRGLEARSCECYAVIRKGYDQLCATPTPRSADPWSAPRDSGRRLPAGEAAATT